jgi:MYXO-CTERM domain-containing protein
MKAKLQKPGVLAAAVLLAAATAQAGAADSRHGNTEQLVVASLSDRSASSRFSPESGTRADFSLPAYDAFALAGQALDAEAGFGGYFARMVPLENGGGEPRASRVATQAGAPAVPVRIGAASGRGDRVFTAQQPSLPEPGNWAMVLAGLLGVGAIARRRMSA